MFSLGVLGSQAEPHVILLDDPDLFVETIGQDVGAVVEWYAPWCKWCKKFRNEYAKLPARVADAAYKRGATLDEAAVIIAAINVDASSDLAHRYNIDALPTIQWIPPGAGNDPGQAITYSGKRTLKKLVPWVRERQKANPNLDAGLLTALGQAPEKDQGEVLILTSENFEHVTQNKDKNVLVTFDVDWCEHSQALRPTLNRLAYIFGPEENCQVARINAEDNLDISQEYGVHQYPRLVVRTYVHVRLGSRIDPFSLCSSSPCP